MTGPKVQFKITTRTGGKFTNPNVAWTEETAHLFKPKYSTGQIIFVEDEGNIYLDFHRWRKCYTNDDQTNIRFLGVADEDPTLAPESGIIHINGNEVTPSPNDMVAWNKKEYLWREDKEQNGVFKWFEIGNEDAPEWQNDDMSWDDETT